MRDRKGRRKRAPEISAEIGKVVSALKDGERILIAIRDELHDGSWDALRRYLEDQLRGIAATTTAASLRNRIVDDIRRVRKMEGIEARYGINLSDTLAAADDLW